MFRRSASVKINYSDHITFYISYLGTSVLWDYFKLSVITHHFDSNVINKMFIL